LLLVSFLHFFFVVYNSLHIQASKGSPVLGSITTIATLTGWYVYDITFSLRFRYLFKMFS